MYRTAVGQLLWVPQLRVDIAYAVKELSRALHYQPTVDDSDSASTIARDIRDNMETLMWNSLTSSHTSPIVRSQLQRAGIILQTNDEPRNNTTT
eukprot:4202431-Amphidinium_carterae.1